MKEKHKGPVSIWWISKLLMVKNIGWWYQNLTCKTIIIWINKLIKTQVFSPSLMALLMAPCGTACFKDAVRNLKHTQMTKWSFSLPGLFSFTPLIPVFYLCILPGPDHGDDDRVLPLYLHNSGNVPCLLMQIISFVLISSLL